MDETYFDGARRDVDIAGLLDKSNDQERQRLDAELQRIDQELDERDSILAQAVNELDSKLEWYVGRLEMLYTRSLGKHGDRERLKGRIESLYQALRDERRAHWRDRQQLLADRRRLERDRTELEDLDLSELLW